MKAFREDIHVKIDALPPQKRGEVEDFVEFLLSREQDTENLGGDKRRRTLKGFWKGSEVDAGLFADARRDLSSPMKKTSHEYVRLRHADYRMWKRPNSVVMSAAACETQNHA